MCCTVIFSNAPQGSTAPLHDSIDLLSDPSPSPPYFSFFNFVRTFVSNANRSKSVFSSCLVAPSTFFLIILKVNQHVSVSVFTLVCSRLWAGLFDPDDPRPGCGSVDGTGPVVCCKFYLSTFNKASLLEHRRLCRQEVAHLSNRVAAPLCLG